MSKHVLITGATKGIGRACVDIFAQNNWRITAIARTADDLAALEAALPGASVITLAADLSTEAGVAAVPVLAYDAIILNAATFAPGQLLTGTPDAFTDLWALNVKGNHLMARRLLPALLAARQGHLLVVGSLGTDYWPAHLTAYVATKYALRGLFLGWQAELADTGIHTTLIAPGATLTASWEKEEPPADILPADYVAAAIFRAIQDQQTGRMVVT